MQQAFVFNELAITVRHWYEINGDPDEEEHGVRIEVRTLKTHSHRGSLAAPQAIEWDGIIWRADLFDRIGEKPGSFGRAHHHTRFDGVEPLDRAWDAGLTADPLGWTAEQLSDVARLAESAGVALQDAEGEAEDVRRHLPQIMVAARGSSPTECTSPRRCLEETRDTADLTLQMVVERRRPVGPASDPRVST